MARDTPRIDRSSRAETALDLILSTGASVLEDSVAAGAQRIALRIVSSVMRTALAEWNGPK